MRFYFVLALSQIIINYISFCSYDFTQTNEFMSLRSYDPSPRQRANQRHKAQNMAPNNVVYQQSAPNYYDQGPAD